MPFCVHRAAPQPLRRYRGGGVPCAHFMDFLLNPDCYETQHQKPHNKLKKAQIQLRENKLSLELKLGGGSTNPRSKGTPQPPLRRKSIRGAFFLPLQPGTFGICRVPEGTRLVCFVHSLFLSLMFSSFLLFCLHLWLLCRLSHVCLLRIHAWERL